MRVLIHCNTYYQLIMAMQMKETRFRNDHVSLIISDHSNNSFEVYKKIITVNSFDSVFYKKTKWIRDYSKNIVSSILRLLKNDLFSDLAENEYDEFVFYNFELTTQILFNCIYNKNKNVQVNRFEEGVLSYGVPMSISKKARLLYNWNKLRGVPSLTDKVEGFYCFQPDFYKGELNPVKVPPIVSNGRVKDVLQEIFNINLEENSYKEKYIFFTSVYDFEGGEPIGEYELVCKIADLVGKENLLIKTHPRDVRTIYEENGFTVDKNSDIPWEVIQLSKNFSDKVFLTATSGSVLAGSFMSENPPKIFFMHKCCNVSGNSSSQKTIATIEDLLCDEALKEPLKTVSIANEIKDILV